jgi:hypothetical protein
MAQPAATEEVARGKKIAAAATGRRESQRDFSLELAVAA